MSRYRKKWRLVLVDKNEYLAMCAAHEHWADEQEVYSKYFGEDAYCKCGGYISDAVRTKCMDCIYLIRRVVVSIALATFTCAFALFIGNLIHG